LRIRQERGAGEKEIVPEGKGVLLEDLVFDEVIDGPEKLFKIIAAMKIKRRTSDDRKKQKDSREKDNKKGFTLHWFFGRYKGWFVEDGEKLQEGHETQWYLSRCRY